ncbi:precorrin-3B synthase [Paraburkholderia sp. BL10I2N1]|nr:precorrin-3B synthase [Paraburkholderia sp. BL10I2N1]
MPATLRPSACPGLLRIVPARDGGICRITLPCGELRAPEALAIADAARQHGSGVIEATNRSNLQIRGVRAGHETALVERLLEAGLGPRGGAEATDGMSASARDDVRNLMTSPLAGRDSHALIDTTPLAAQILALLQGTPRFAGLSPKFALLLDGGERLARLDHPHDIWLAAMPDGARVRFAFGLAGCPPVAGSDAALTPALAAVEPSEVPELVCALLDTFLELAFPDDTRMRNLLATHSSDTILERVERRVNFTLLRRQSVRAWRRVPADASFRLGAHPQNADGLWHVGGQPPLGRMDSPMLHGLAELASESGNATVRMTPWQGVLLPDIEPQAVSGALERLASLGLACEPADPLTRVIACAGSTGCAKGNTDTKADARALAARLPERVEVHLSGCPRSCAAAHCAPYTLLAVAPLRYDLYRRDGTPGFGQCIAHHLTIEQAADSLERLARSPLDA